jgi:hypothetical protein
MALKELRDPKMPRKAKVKKLMLRRLPKKRKRMMSQLNLMPEPPKLCLTSKKMKKTKALTLMLLLTSN